LSPVLTPAERELLATARRATLATTAADGRPRLVPVCFVTLDDVVWTPLDEKPKAVDDLRSLARVRDILDRPGVSLLVDRWSEDWAELAWLRIHGQAAVVASHARAVEGLRAKYRQYTNHNLESRPMIRIAIERVASWEASPARRSVE
jgi:PPOX class probable F420-dependent enzyme